eukprot:1159295-Pelagomonas_calceolata.AAC.1
MASVSKAKHMSLFVKGLVAYHSLMPSKSSSLHVMKSMDGSVKSGESLYDVLKVPSSASLEQIKLAYRHFARKFHPDLFQPGPDQVVVVRGRTGACVFISCNILMRAFTEAHSVPALLILI